MRARDLLLTLDDASAATLTQRICEALQRAVLDGRLAPGTALPGSRALAEVLGVNRQTVIFAQHELVAQGWLVMEPNRGAFVARDLPSGAPTRPLADPGFPGQAGFDFPSFLQPVSVAASGALVLADGAADPRLAPTEALAKGYQRALRRHGERLLGDRDPMGTPLLREAIADWVAERHGVKVDPARVLVTRGSRGALALLAGTLFRPAEVAAVENPGNRGAWEILQQTARLTLRPVPLDGEGLDVAALADLFERERVRLLHVTARRQFPTGRSMPRERGLAVLALAAQHRVAVLEDDFDGELCFAEHRPEPLLSLDRTGQVVHVGSLSRLLAPGLRLGYRIAPASLAPFLARAKRTREEQGDPAFEWAVADLIRDGELARHLRRTRRIYQERRDLLVTLLRQRLGGRIQVDPPEGGMGLWIRVLPGTDAEAWVKAARALGLVLNPPSHFFLEAPEPAFRMGFAQANEAELREAVARLEAALRAV